MLSPLLLNFPRMTAMDICEFVPDFKSPEGVDEVSLLDLENEGAIPSLMVRFNNNGLVDLLNQGSTHTLLRV